MGQEGRRRHRRDRQAGVLLRHRAARRPRHDHARVQGGEGIRAVGGRAAARGAAAEGTVGLDQVRRVRHHFRLRLEPDGGQRVRQALSAGHDAVLRRDHRAHRRRASGGGALQKRRGEKEVPVHVRPLPGSDRAPQDERSVGLAADQGQHRGRPDHDRGKGAGQHPENRPQVRGRRRARQGRGADRAGAVVHGLVLGRRGDGDAVRGLRASRCTYSPPGRAT